MDPRKFLKRLARELGLLRNDSTPRPEKVSEPENFEHRVHVALDEDSGGFLGLPPQWKQIVGKTKPTGDLSSETARSKSERNFTRRREANDDRGLDHTLSRTNTGSFTSFAASLETPRSRASVADSQDLIIERLKRELRDYKARNPFGFGESSEDVFHLSNKRTSTQNLNIASQPMSPYRVSAANHERFNNTFPRSLRSNLDEFDESLEDDLFPNQYEQRSTSNGNTAQSSKSSLSPTKIGNGNGVISRQPPAKLNGLKPNGNPRVFRRSESEV